MMKKALSLLLAFALCLSLCACAKSNNDDSTSELKEILCSYEWVSTDRIHDLGYGYTQTYPTIRFFEDGTLEYVLESYKDGQIVSSGTHTEKWEIKNGKVAIIPENVDSDTDITYYEYKDGILIGSAWYCDRFTYTQGAPTKTATSNSEETTNATLEAYPAVCYPDTGFPTIDFAVNQMNSEPTIIQEDLCVRYRYTHENPLLNDYYNINGEYQNFSKSYKNDILSQFVQEKYIHEISDTISYSYTVWFDEEGYALMVEGKLIESMSDGNSYHLDICIIAEDNVQAYIDTLD